MEATRFRFPFMRWRRVGLALSTAITLLSLLAVAVWGLNLGIDFTGGSLWTLHFQHPASAEAIRDVFAEHGFGDAIVQSVDTSGASVSEFVVRTRPAGEEARRALTEALRREVGEFQLVSFDDVSAAIGREIQLNALKALAAATLGMIVYISLRFEYRFALTAIVALIHDILVMIGFFAIFRFEVDAAFIAAILTIFGYSVNDTIIIYDRIRENRSRYRRDQLMELVDDSVNQTLRRTLNTSLTTALAIAAVAVFGGDTIRPFALALLVGIVTGTYSSVFIAAALWLEWCQRVARSKAAA